MDKDIKIGDMVRLKSDPPSAPWMVVIELGDFSDSLGAKNGARCEWRNVEKGRIEGTFSITSLTKDPEE